MRIVLLFAALALVVRAAEPPPITLLFAGSSSTYWNDFPREVAKVVDRKISGRASAPVVPEIVGRSGSDIRVYLEPGFDRYEYGVRNGQTFLDKLREERPALVVLQTVCSFITDEKNVGPHGANAHAAAVAEYCQAIRAAGGEPVFYEMGWGKGEREADGRERIRQLAVQQRVRLYAPCSSAWARVYRERPALALQHPQDNAHPGDAGHFLNLACFYAALTGESPVGKLPRSFPVWPHGKYEPDPAKLAAFQPDAYQSRMAKWMFKHMAMNQTAALDEENAMYLETVAWETWQATRRSLTETADAQ
jgi:hypothetical protein